MPKSVRRKTAPNDVPALFFASVLIIMYWGFCSLGSVFSSALLGIVPVLWVVGLRQLPWSRVRSRWQWRSFLSCVIAFSLSLGILFSAGYWRWWLFLVFIVFFVVTLIGMQLHRWTSLFMSLSCAIMGWLLL